MEEKESQQQPPPAPQEKWRVDSKNETTKESSGTIMTAPNTTTNTTTTTTTGIAKKKIQTETLEQQHLSQPPPATMTITTTTTKTTSSSSLLDPHYYWSSSSLPQQQQQQQEQNVGTSSTTHVPTATTNATTEETTDPNHHDETTTTNHSNDNNKNNSNNYNNNNHNDNLVQNGDTVLLVFADGRHVFAEAICRRPCHGGGAVVPPSVNKNNNTGTVKIQRRSYSTSPLVGVPYGTVVQVERNHLQILPPTESSLIPPLSLNPDNPGGEEDEDDDNNNDEGDGDDEEQGDDENNNENNNNSTNGKGMEDEEEQPQGDGGDEQDKHVTDGMTTGTRSVQNDSKQRRTDESNDKSPQEQEQQVLSTKEPPPPPSLQSFLLSNNKKRDNRHLVDTNTSQGLNQQELVAMRQAPNKTGQDIVHELIQNSTTFAKKTEFSQAKYIRKKQLKYQVRCRIVKCTSATISQAVYLRDPKRCSNMIPETLACILSQANITAGHRILVWEDLPGGLLTGAIGERLGGYGQVFSIYTGPHPSSHEVCIKQYNMTFGVQSTIHWVHAADIFKKDDDDNDNNDDDDNNNNESKDNTNTTKANRQKQTTRNNSHDDDNDKNHNASAAEVDLEAQERNAMSWPCPLQDHTREYLKTATMFANKNEQEEFLHKRCRRFVRKLTRPSPLESAQLLQRRPVDALILAIRNIELIPTVKQLWQYLAPSAPVVIFCEYLEPLTQVFSFLQQPTVVPSTGGGGGGADDDDEEKESSSARPCTYSPSTQQQQEQQELTCCGAIQLRLTAGWTREYQVLPQRTHPCMNMTQHGGFLLTGTKLHEVQGCQNELDPYVLSKIRANLPTRRGKKRKPTDQTGTTGPSLSSSEPQSQGNVGNAATTTSGGNNEGTSGGDKTNNNKGGNNHRVITCADDMDEDADSGTETNINNKNNVLLKSQSSQSSIPPLTMTTTTTTTTTPMIRKRKTPRKRKRPRKLPTTRSTRMGQEDADDDDDADDEREYDDEEEATAANCRNDDDDDGNGPRQIRILYGKDMEALFFSKKRRKQAKPKQRPIILPTVVDESRSRGLIGSTTTTGASVVSVPSDDNCNY